MEEDSDRPFTHKNPKYLVGGSFNGNAFVITAGENIPEINRGLEAVAVSLGGFIPKLGDADVYVRVDDTVLSARTGFDISIPGEGT